MAFAYTINPLEMAESMAFNRDCLGCVCWFEYGRIVAKPGSKDFVSRELAPYVRFFHTHRDLLREARIVADVAVLRSFPSQVFADSKHAVLTGQVEEMLIEDRTCFQIIYNQHLDDLSRYRVLVLAGCIALADGDVKHIERYVKAGGRLCIIGPAVTHDEWMLPRRQPALDHLPPDGIVRISQNGNILDAIRRACGDRLSLSIGARAGLCAELTEKTGRFLVHLVNYRSDSAAKNVIIHLRLPAGSRARSVSLANPEQAHELPLLFEHQDDIVTFTVREVKVYQIAVVTIQQRSFSKTPGGEIPVSLKLVDPLM